MLLSCSKVSNSVYSPSYHNLLFWYLCTLYTWEVISTTQSRPILEPISQIYLYLFLSLSYNKVVLYPYLLFCTTNVLLCIQIQKAVYNEIRPTNLRYNVTCTKMLSFTVPCISNQHFYSEGNVHITL